MSNFRAPSLPLPVNWQNQLLNGLIIWSRDATPIAAPLIRVSASASLFPVQGFNTAEVEVEQEYRNPNDGIVQCKYSFPLAHGSTVFFYSVQINESEAFVGVMREKQEAIQAYRAAIYEGKSASLLEQERMEGFTTTIGNIPASATVRIKIRYVSELKIDAANGYRFMLPTTVVPRYSMSGSSASSAVEASALVSSAQAAARVPFSFKATVIVDSSDEITITSPTHTLSAAERDAGGRSMSVHTSSDVDARLGDSDFVLSIKKEAVEASAPAVTQLFMDSDNSLHGAHGILAHIQCPELPPASESILEPNLEFIFMLDRSGSMSGSSIHLVSEMMDLILRSLPETCRLNIIGFGSRYETLFPESKPFAEAVGPALAHCATLQADLGGTQLLSPFQYLTGGSAVPANHVRMVMLLTDGAVSDPESVIRLVSDNADTMRVFGLGIGSGVSTHLVDGIASACNGSSAYCVSGERFEDKISHLIDQAEALSASRRLRDIHLELIGAGASHYMLVEPARNRCLGRPGDELKITALVAPLSPLGSSATLPLPQLRVVAQFIDQEFVIPANPNPQQLPLGGLLGRHIAGQIAQKASASGNKHEAVMYSTKYSVSCPDTAFVAISPETSAIIGSRDVQRQMWRGYARGLNNVLAPSPPTKCSSRSAAASNIICTRPSYYGRTKNPWVPSRLRSNSSSEAEKIKGAVRSLLNKIAPENYGKLKDEILALIIANKDSDTKVVVEFAVVIHETVLIEPRLCKLFAVLCRDIHAAATSPACSSSSPSSSSYSSGSLVEVDFKKILATICQVEFESEGVIPDRDSMCRDRLAEAERKILERKVANVKFIAELFKVQMVGFKIMHFVIRCLLLKNGFEYLPSEQELEILCKFLTFIGQALDTSSDAELFNKYFVRLSQLADTASLSRRIRCMIQGLVLRGLRKWVPHAPFTQKSSTLSSSAAAPVLAAHAASSSSADQVAPSGPLPPSAPVTSVAPAAPVSGIMDHRARSQALIRLCEPVKATWVWNEEMQKLCGLPTSLLAAEEDQLKASFASAFGSPIAAVFDHEPVMDKKMTIVGTLIALAYLQSAKFGTQKASLQRLLDKSTLSVYTLLAEAPISIDAATAASEVTHPTKLAVLLQVLRALHSETKGADLWVDE